MDDAMLQDSKVFTIKGPTIALHSGEYFDFIDPMESVVTIDDVAHALSNLCRFTGHVKRFYSVAQHCVVMSEMVAPEFAYEALMHDAPESVMGDVSSPLKMLIPDYKNVERLVTEAFAKKFGFTAKTPPEVKHADVRMLATEQREVMRNSDVWAFCQGVEPYDIIISPWTPWEAKHRFLQRYYVLTGDVPKEAGRD